MKKLLGILALIVLPVLAFSQYKIDSLKGEIAGRSGIDQFEPMVALVRAWWALDSVRHSLYAMENARALALRYGDTAKITQTGRMAGIIYNRLNMYVETEALMTWAIPVARRHGHMSEWSSMMHSLATAYGFLGRFDEALKVHFENLQNRRIHADYKAVSIVPQ